MAATHLVFEWRTTGYELHEREGEPPQPGDVLEEDGLRLTVVKVADSPFPGDPRRCAYLHPAP